MVELVIFTCKWPNSQLDPPLVASLCRLVLIHSMASYVIWHGPKSVTFEIVSHANFCWVTPVTRGGHAQVIGRSLISHKASQVSRRSVPSDSWHSGCGSGARVYAGKLTNGVRGLRARKSVMVRSQITIITWPIIQFLFTHMSVAPHHWCKG